MLKKTIGMIVTIGRDFGKKGFYHSQEIGLGKELVKMGYKVIIYKAEFSKKEKTVERIEENLVQKNIPCKRLGVHGLLSPKCIDDKLDAMMMFSDTQIAVKPMYEYCVKNKIPFIPYAGVAQSTIRGGFISFWMNNLFKIRTLPVYKKVAPIVKTEEAKKQFESLGIYGCEIATVGLDFSNLNEDFRSENRDIIRAKLGYEKEENLILFVGRLDPHKHPLEAVDIFSNVLKTKPNSKMAMIGIGELKDALLEKIKEMGLDSKIRVMGAVPHDNIWKWYYGADYFINLSSVEIFGMAIMEALFYECSVVAIEAPGPKEILSDMPSCFLCENYEKMTAALSKERPSDAMITEDACKLQKNFSWQKCAEAISRRVEA